jgi:hypothetical protein
MQKPQQRPQLSDPALGRSDRHPRALHQQEARHLAAGQALRARLVAPSRPTPLQEAPRRHLVAQDRPRRQAPIPYQVTAVIRQQIIQRRARRRQFRHQQPRAPQMRKQRHQRPSRRHPRSRRRRCSPRRHHLLDTNRAQIACGKTLARKPPAHTSHHQHLVLRRPGRIAKARQFRAKRLSMSRQRAPDARPRNLLHRCLLSSRRDTTPRQAPRSASTRDYPNRPSGDLPQTAGSNAISSDMPPGRIGR